MRYAIEPRATRRISNVTVAQSARLASRLARSGVRICSRSRAYSESSEQEYYRIASIILSRFILDLRYDPNEHAGPTTIWISMHVASGIEGNMGAPLNSIWGSGLHNDQEDDEDMGSTDGQDERLSAG